jgi:NAD(P)-dependent dehydrogenase (short-subunit alcohol dehydrogenase family)
VHKIGRIHFDDINLEHGYGIFKAYAQSKLANVLFTRELAKKLQGTKVTVNCLHPGAVATNIGVDRKTGFGKSLMGLTKYFFLSPDQGAQTAIWLASSDEVSGYSGLYFFKKKAAKVANLAEDSECSEKLWSLSETMTGLKS